MPKLVDKVKLIVAMCADGMLTDAEFRVAAAEVFAFCNTVSGRCDPSGPQIAEASACCRDTVIEANKKLARLGYMQIERSSGGRNKRNAYRFDWAKGERETVDGSDGIEAETVGTVDGIGGHKPSERHAETVDGSDAHITQEEHRKRKRESNDSLFTDADDIEIAFKEYNEVAKNLGLSIAGRLTPGRRAKLRTRLKDVRLPGWRKALEQLAHSSIITGGASSGWRCDLDFLLRPDKLQRLIEGGYLSKPQPEKDWRPSDTGFWVKCDSPPGRAWDEFWKKTKNTRHWEYEPGGEIHVDSLWPNRR